MAKHLAQSDSHELKSKTKEHARRWKEKLIHIPPESRFADTMGKLRYVAILLPPVLLFALRFLPLEGWMIPAANLIPLLLALSPILPDAFSRLLQKNPLANEILTVLAAVVLFACGLYREATLLAVFFSASTLLEGRLTEKSRERLQAVSDILPTSVSVVTENGIEERDAREVQPGELLLVEAGERIPLDGVVAEGVSTIDTASVSGQRSPWAVNEGYRVYSGCTNLTSPIKLRVTKEYEQSSAQRIVRILRDAEDFCSEQEQQARTFSSFVVLGLTACAFVAGLVLPIFRGGWLSHLCRGAVLLMAARPLADAFAIPLAYRKALALTAQMGVFSKGEDCFESTAKAATFVFDKTGTVTEGRCTVRDVVPVGMSEDQLLLIAALAESKSRHPIAQALRDAAGPLNRELVDSVRFREEPGRGVRAAVGKKLVLVGNAAFLEENDIQAQIPDRPGSAVHVAVDRRYCGYILVHDKLRRRAFDALEGLRVNGVEKLVLLTGDVLSVARPMASKLNFDMLRAELKPEDKIKALTYLMDNKGEREAIAFVGDGGHAGKIMGLSDVGIAMGSLGSDAALATADVLIMDRDIMKIPRFVEISRSAYRVSRQNLFAAVGLSLAAALFAFLGILPALWAELLCFAGSVAVLLNTQRIS